MKRRKDMILELALNDKDNTIPDENRVEKSGKTPRRRYTIHEIPSPRAFITVTTNDNKETKPFKRSKRAKSLFPESNYDNSENLAEPLVASLEEYDDTSIQCHQNPSVICEDIGDSCVISTSSTSSYQNNVMSFQSQESSNSNSSVLVEPQPSTSKLSATANDNFYSLRRGIKTRGGVAKQKGIKIIRSQKVEVEDGKIKLTDLVEKSESSDDFNLDRNVQDLDIMDKMRIIFNEDNKEENQKEKREVNPPCKKKPLSDKDLFKMLKSDEDDLEIEGNQENLSDDCLFSDESEEDATQESEYETQMSEDETQSQVSEDAAPGNEDNNISSNGSLQVDGDEWKSECDPTIVPIEFNGHENRLKILPEKNEPYDYFELIATDDFYTMLVTNINNYASRLLSNIQDPKSRMRLWKDVTVQELKVFLGLLFHMGTIRLNRITDYWKKDPLFNITAFSNHMSRNRFLLILRSLNFGDDLTDNNRLSKINNLINYFNQRMEEIYCPSKNLAIDESMVLFRGRLIFRQYLKGKKQKYGIKLYILTDEYGVVLKTIVYAGAKDTLVGGTNHTEKVVLNLLTNYLNQGYSIYMDNYYNSVNLAQKLLTLKTYCTGTLRKNRKNNPKEVTQKKLKRGDSIAKFNRNGICVMKWKDRRDVLMISSQFKSDMTSVTNRRGETVSKPEMIKNYNKYMGGIDHQDQMLAYYSCEHKSIRWYKRLGVHVFQQMIYNSYTLHNTFSPKKSFYDYRLQVIEKLLNNNNIRDTARDSLPKKQVHVLQLCSHTYDSDNKKKVLRRRCRQCWVSKKVRKDTPYFCPDCPEQYGFCLNNCFKDYHSY